MEWKVKNLRYNTRRFAFFIQAVALGTNTKRNFATNSLVTWAALLCLVAWVVAAFHPLDRSAWLLENILLFLFVGALALTYRRLRLSTAAWLCLAAFILLHIVGAHYTYAQMPIGNWARDHFGMSRNHYDRVGHAAFGFFLAYPVREVAVRFSGVRGSWSYWIPVATILAGSGVFEIIESGVAEIMAPGQGVTWLGGQGDQWDAQNDMVAALSGAMLMMGLLWLFRRNRPAT